jgi:hypothetical protein
MMKKLFSALLISITLITTTALAYNDVPQDSEYFFAAEYLRRANAIKNTPNFKPDTVISKAEFIKYMVIVNNREFKPERTTELPFDDTRDNAWYAPYFKEAIEQGILNEDDVKVYPYSKLNTPEALRLLFRSKSIPIPRRYVGTILYKDVKNNLQAPLIMKGIEMGIAVPEKTDYFGVHRKLTRGNAILMIYKMELADANPPALSGEEIIGGSDDFYLQKIIDSWNLIHQNYINNQTLDENALTDAAIRAMTEALNDPYSVYLDKIENSSFSDDLDGEIEGIGAVIELKNDEIVVVSPLVNSPAMKAGIQGGIL